MVITIIDKNFNYVGFIDEFESLRVKNKYIGPNDFELKLPFSIKALELLKNENMMFYEKGNWVNCYVVENRNLDNSNGEETITIKGRSILVYIENRIIAGTVQFTQGVVADIFRTIFDLHLSYNASTPNRYLKGMVTDFQYFNEKIDYQNSYGYVLQEFQKLAENTNLGLTALYGTLGGGVITLKTYRGVDRSKNQTVNKPIVFSRELDNILEEHYSEDIKGYKNVAYVAGEGEGSARTIVTINDSASGFNRRELFVDARDLQRKVNINGVEKILTDAQYKALLIQRGNEKLKECEKVSSLEGKIVTNLNGYEYKKDWDKGDIVTVEDRIWGVTMDTRITEVEEAYYNGQAEFIPIFGKKTPSLIEKIKKMR